eukprot:6021381-Pyramimonas_sp.AAC.1
MLAAAFGPVPCDVAPLQLSADGEDYAFFVLCSLADALDIEGVWADCAGTIAAARSRVRSTSAKNLQAHLWCHFHSVFESGLPVHKTKAHA